MRFWVLGHTHPEQPTAALSEGETSEQGQRGKLTMDTKTDTQGWVNIIISLWGKRQKAQNLEGLEVCLHVAISSWTLELPWPLWTDTKQPFLRFLGGTVTALSQQKLKLARLTRVMTTRPHGGNQGRNRGIYLGIYMTGSSITDGDLFCDTFTVLLLNPLFSWGFSFSKFAME